MAIPTLTTAQRNAILDVALGVPKAEPQRSGPGIKPAAGMVVRYQGEAIRTLPRDGFGDGLGSDGSPTENGWNAGKITILSSPAPDPRDVAIAQWPWMVPFREVKVGDKFAYNSMAAPREVTAVNWDDGGIWIDGVPWGMAGQGCWCLLTPYREARPVEPQCKGAPCGMTCDEFNRPSVAVPAWTITVCYEQSRVFCSPACRDKAKAPVYLDPGSSKETYDLIERVKQAALASVGITYAAKAKPAAPWKCAHTKCTTPDSPPSGNPDLTLFCVACWESTKAATSRVPLGLQPLATFTAFDGRHELARAGGWRAYR